MVIQSQLESEGKGGREESPGEESYLIGLCKKTQIKIIKMRIIRSRTFGSWGHFHPFISLPFSPRSTSRPHTSRGSRLIFL
jgi:hypothetical protein